jgi:hypothetical protein
MHSKTPWQKFPGESKISPVWGNLTFLVTFRVNLTTVLVNLIIVLADLTRIPGEFNQAIGGLLLTRKFGLIVHLTFSHTACFNYPRNPR